MNMSEWLFWNEKYNINMYNEQKCKYINFEDVQRELNITHMFDGILMRHSWIHYTVCWIKQKGGLEIVVVLQESIYLISIVFVYICNTYFVMEWSMWYIP